MDLDTAVELELAHDRRIYGSCFWRVIDGKKYRVHPQDVYYDIGSNVPQTKDGEIVESSVSATPNVSTTGD